MTSDELEFSISQYADGTLPAGQRPAVDAALAADPAARRVLAEYRRLNQLLAAPPAGVDWDRLAAHLSAAVDDERADERLARPAVAGRIGPAWRSPWRIGSVAAAAAMAVTVGLLAHHGRPAGTPVPAGRQVVEAAVAEVTGPGVESATVPPEAQVTIGPSPALAARAGSGRYAEDVISRTPRVVIAGAEAVSGAGPRVR